MGAVALAGGSGQQDGDLTYTAPATPEEFWRRDWVYVIKLTRTLLKDSQEAEDIAADIFEKLLTRDVPGMYKPGVVSAHTKRRVTWRAFLSNQVALYCRGKQEQVDRRLYREPLLCDSTALAGDYNVRWVELFGGAVWDDYPSLSESEFILRIREFLSGQPEWAGEISLVTVFEEILALVTAGEKVSVAYLRRKFGLSSPDAQAALARIREVIAGSAYGLSVSVELPGDVPVTFEVAGLRLTVQEVRDAAACLRTAKGNQVRRAFAAVGHRLAECGTKWYLAFAAEELREYPELRLPKGSHAGGHNDQVKQAVIHRLERMTALALVPGTQEQPVT